MLGTPRVVFQKRISPRNRCFRSKSPSSLSHRTTGPCLLSLQHITTCRSQTRTSKRTNPDYRHSFALSSDKGRLQTTSREAIRRSLLRHTVVHIHHSYRISYTQSNTSRFTEPRRSASHPYTSTHSFPGWHILRHDIPNSTLSDTDHLVHHTTLTSIISLTLGYHFTPSTDSGPAFRRFSDHLDVRTLPWQTKSPLVVLSAPSTVPTLLGLSSDRPWFRSYNSSLLRIFKTLVREFITTNYIESLLYLKRAGSPKA